MFSGWLRYLTKTLAHGLKRRVDIPYSVDILFFSSFIKQMVGKWSHWSEMSGMCAVLLVECSRTLKWTMYIIFITATHEFVYEIILQEALRKTSVAPLPSVTNLGRIHQNSNSQIRRRFRSYMNPATISARLHSQSATASKNITKIKYFYCASQHCERIFALVTQFCHHITRNIYKQI